MDQKVEEPVVDNEAERIYQSLGEEVLVAMIDELKIVGTSWQQLSEEKQDEAISRIRQRLIYFIQKVATQVIAQDAPALPVVIDQVVFKDGMKVTLSAGKMTSARHEIADATGQVATLLLTDLEGLFVGMSDIKGDPQQLPLAEEGGDFHA